MQTPALNVLNCLCARCVALSEDGLLAAAGGEDCCVSLWRCVPPVGLFGEDGSGPAPSPHAPFSSPFSSGPVDLGGSSLGFGAVMDDFEGVRRTLRVFDDDVQLDVQAQLESSVSVVSGRRVAERISADAGDLGVILLL